MFADNSSFVDHSSFFFTLFTDAVRTFDLEKGSKPRSGRKRATFTENELRRFIKNSHRPPDLHLECEVADDIPCAAQGGQRKIDYVRMERQKDLAAPTLRSVAASCELKGPARPTLWKSDTKNWYEQLKNGEPYGIKVDVLKQYQRAKLSPETEHYVLWIVEPPDGGADIDIALAGLLRRLRSDVEGAELVECGREDIEGLWVFLFRVSRFDDTGSPL